MDQFFEFAGTGSNPMWIIAFVVVSGLLVMDILKGFNRSFQFVQPADATRMINHENAVVLDVRDEKDYKSGHILNAIHVPMGLLEGQLGKLEKYRETPVIVCCRTGQVSQGSCTLLAKNGFAKLYNLRGGMMGWTGANLPTVKD